MHKRKTDRGPFERLMDWGEIGLELRRRGWKQSEIAEAIGKSQSTVAGWFTDGTEPNWSDGMRLIALYMKITGGRDTNLRFFGRYRRLGIEGQANAQAKDT